MELLGNNPSMQDLIQKLNEVVRSLNDSLPNTNSELAEVKRLVSFGSSVLASRLNAKLWYFKTQELMKASTELCEGDSCFILNPGSNTGEGTFEYWYVYKTEDVSEILDSYIELSNPDLIGVKIQELTFKALLSKFDSIKKFSFLDLVTTVNETNPGKALDAIVGKLLADRIGNLGELSTVDKNSLVGAIKEVKTIVEDNYSENTKKINSKAERTELQTETSERKQEISVERARIDNLLKSTSDTVTVTCNLPTECGENASAEVSSDGVNVQINLTNFEFLLVWESSDGTEATASPEKILDLPNHSFAPFEERTVVHTAGALSYYIENDSLYVTSSTDIISIFGDVTISYTIVDPLQSELADIRVGADGKVYDTAGEAVRGQVSELKSDLTNTKSRMSELITDIDNGYIQIDSIVKNLAVGGLSNGIYNPTIKYRVSSSSAEEALSKDTTIIIASGRRIGLQIVGDDGSFISDSGWVTGSYTIPKDKKFMLCISSTASTTIEEQQIKADVNTFASYVKYKSNIEKKFDQNGAEHEEINYKIDKINSDIAVGESYLKDVTGDYTIKNGYYGKDGVYNTEPLSEATELIPVAVGETFYVTCLSQYITCGCVFFDTQKKKVRSLLYDGTSEHISVDAEVVAQDGESYVAFSSYQGTQRKHLVIKKLVDYVVKDKFRSVDDEILTIKKSNVLYGKKYVACGDSFTEGAFENYTDDNGKTGKESNAYDADLKMWKTYPWHIASRNNMTLVNEAKSGSDFTNAGDASNPFSVSRYLSVPHDADYITLAFGLNENGILPSSLGTSSDTTNETLWGAYNIVFTHFLTNMPFAKIGVIINDAWMSEEYANAVQNICEYWGVPCLNLKSDKDVPMMISGKFSNHSATSRQLRNNAFQMSSDDMHPNPKAHEYRSTIIEAWLRTL